MKEIKVNVATIEKVNLSLFLKSTTAAIYMLKIDLIIFSVCILLAILGIKALILFKKYIRRLNSKGNTGHLMVNISKHFD